MGSEMCIRDRATAAAVVAAVAAAAAAVAAVAAVAAAAVAAVAAAAAVAVAAAAVARLACVVSVPGGGLLNRGCFGLVCIFFRNGITVWCVVGLIYGLGGACDKNFGLKRCLEAPGKQFHRFRGQKPNVNCDKINPMCNG